jgi:ABC-type nitrate/sulfonate/bicarbonate transport system permease component
MDIEATDEGGPKSNSPAWEFFPANAFGYLALPVALVGIWQWVSAEGILPSYLLPSPLATAKGFWEILLDGTLISSLQASLFRSVSGFAIATAIAVPFGILIGWFKQVRRTTQLTLLILIPIPITAWVSIAILWFGLGDRSAIFLVALGASVPILINTIHGVEWVDVLYVEAARTLGTGPREILWRIVLPAALPNIFTGLRLGLRNSWAGLVIAEMIGARSGVGYLIWDSRLTMRSDLLIVGMLLIGMLGLFSDQLMYQLSKAVLRWHEDPSRDDD